MATYRALISICHIYILLCRLLISKSRFLHLFHSSNHAGNCIFPQLQTGADNMSNKTALITGGATGIGKETAKKLLAKGVNIVISGVYQRRCEGEIRAE